MMTSVSPSSVPKKSFFAENKKTIGGILGIIIAVAIATQPLPSGLSAAGLKAVAILCWAVIYWVFDVFPDYVVGLAMSALFVITKTAPMNVAFAAYSSDAWWLLVAAIGLGAAATKTGLLTRISLVVLKIFPATYKGQVMALIGCGTFLGTLIPSTTAKMAIMSPVALSISNALGFEKKSPGATGIFAACGTGFNLSSPFLMSSSFLAYVAVSLLPKAEQAQFTWSFWFLCAACSTFDDSRKVATAPTILVPYFTGTRLVRMRILPVSCSSPASVCPVWRIRSSLEFGTISTMFLPITSDEGMFSVFSAALLKISIAPWASTAIIPS